MRLLFRLLFRLLIFQRSSFSQSEIYEYNYGKVRTFEMIKGCTGISPNPFPSPLLISFPFPVGCRMIPNTQRAAEFAQIGDEKRHAMST